MSSSQLPPPSREIPGLGPTPSAVPPSSGTPPLEVAAQDRERISAVDAPPHINNNVPLKDDCWINKLAVRSYGPKMSRFIGFFLNARTRLLNIMGGGYDQAIKRMEVKDRCILLKLISANIISVRAAQQYLAVGISPEATIRTPPLPSWFNGLRTIAADGIAAKIIAAIKRGQASPAEGTRPTPLLDIQLPPPQGDLQTRPAIAPTPVPPARQDYRDPYEPPRGAVHPAGLPRPKEATRGDNISPEELAYIEAHVQQWLDDPATGIPPVQGNVPPITAERLTVVGPGMPKGDILQQPVEAIVNAAQPELTGGSGIDGAIHRAAGRELYNYCVRLPPHGSARCPTGAAAITPSFGITGPNREIKHIIHTVGPVGSGDLDLASAYFSCYLLAAQNGIRSIAFCGIGVGIYGFPKGRGAKIAMLVSRLVLHRLPQMEKVVFACTDPLVFGPFQSEAGHIVSG